MKIYVCSHQRAGTHWLINTILKNSTLPRCCGDVGPWRGGAQGDHIREYRDGIERAPFVLIKTHAHHELYDAHYRKFPVIYVLRDPRDCLNSLWHMLNRDEFYRWNPECTDHRCTTFAEFLERNILFTFEQ